MATQKKNVSTGSDTTPKQTPAGKESSTGKGSSTGGTTFTPTPEAKKKALTYRLIAVAFWVVAIAAEAVTVFWLIPHTELNNFMVWLIAAIVVIGILAVVGSQFWKKSNRFDPASEKDKVRFFVQNQLGAIITIVAFLPLIIVILSNKDMDKKQKTIAGIVAIIAALIVGAASVDYNPPSTEQIDDQSATAIAYTGQDMVYWVNGGKVYHFCAYHPEGTYIPAFSHADPGTSPIPASTQADSGTNPVFYGTVSDAVQAGKQRLSMYGYSECGLTEGQPQYCDVSGASSSACAEPTSSPS